MNKSNREAWRLVFKVRQIIAKHMNISWHEIKAFDTLGNDLGCDSLDLVTLEMDIEREYNITFEDELSAEMTILRVRLRIQEILHGDI